MNDGPDMKIHLRNYKDNPEKISFRLEGIVAAPLICILSVLNEVDLFSSWVPYFTTPFKYGEGVRAQGLWLKACGLGLKA